jgi:hypothetical protein
MGSQFYHALLIAGNNCCCISCARTRQWCKRYCLQLQLARSWSLPSQLLPPRMHSLIVFLSNRLKRLWWFKRLRITWLTANAALSAFLLIVKYLHAYTSSLNCITESKATWSQCKYKINLSYGCKFFSFANRRLKFRPSQYLISTWHLY